MAKVNRAYRLSPEAIELIHSLAERFGLSHASVIEIAVRLLSEEKLPPKT